jgi:hypothetical protein
VVATGDGTIHVALLDPWNGAWTTGYTEGTASGWLAWASTGGVLQSFSAAALGGDLYLAGRDANTDLWWYRFSDSKWTYVGNRGAAAGGLVASPR